MNVTSGAGLTDGSVTVPFQQAVPLTRDVNWFESPHAICPGPYQGRVGTFYNSENMSYVENYEPARSTAYGLVGRIESRVVGQRWRHIAYGPGGETILSESNDLVLFDQTSLPLMFDPAEDVKFAGKMLAASPKNEVVALPKDVVVYANRERTSVGIIRLKVKI